MTISESALKRRASAEDWLNPLVGIAVPLEQARWRIWGGPALLLGPRYSAHLRRAGAIPLLLPVGGTPDEARSIVARLDGILLAGGVDVDPSRYGQLPHPAAGPFDPDRDEWEASLVRAAAELGVPVLGICRGMQLVNVVRGGTLIQHLPDVVGTEEHSPTPAVFTTHEVRTSTAGWLQPILGETLAVPTYHHQAVDQVAPGLVPAAWATDGTVEALEDGDGMVWAVQWHPEVAEDNAIFGAFVERCVEQRSKGTDPQPITSIERSAQETPRQKEFA